MAVRHTALAAFACVCASTAAWAEKAPASTTSSVTPGVADKAWPITLTESQAKPQPGRAWRPEEIAEAAANCKVLLDGLDVVALAEPPMREGGSCGNAAPMKLVSIGRGSQEVTFSPQPIVTCEMISGLARWLKQDVQPLARRYMGTQVTRIETMSSYSCRNAYGRAHGKLSEHGRANALDIAAFGTERGQIVAVEADWGMTAREIAAARKEQELQRAQEPIKPAEHTTIVATQRVQPETQTTLEFVEPQRTLMPALPGITVQFPSASPSALGFGPPSRLGGPKPRNAPSAVIPPAPPAPRVATGPVSANAKLEFLHAAHKSGCKVFGTVLGPEANRTHRNHFHVDMAERVNDLKVCE